jgi:hypothetical protein
MGTILGAHWFIYEPQHFAAVVFSTAVYYLQTCPFSTNRSREQFLFIIIMLCLLETTGL